MRDARKRCLPVSEYGRLLRLYLMDAVTGIHAWPGLLPGGLASLAALLREPGGELLPEASAWVLLLALGLLCELRDPRSR